MDKKKFSAAMAAVFACIKTSEEAALIPGVPEFVQELTIPSGQLVQQNNIWGISGRQTHMQANSMIQMRLFK